MAVLAPVFLGFGPCVACLLTKYLEVGRDFTTPRSDQDPVKSRFDGSVHANRRYDQGQLHISAIRLQMRKRLGG